MQQRISRRDLFKQTTAVGSVAATTCIPMHPAIAQQAKVKIGLLVPYPGTYAERSVFR